MFIKQTYTPIVTLRFTLLFGPVSGPNYAMLIYMTALSHSTRTASQSERLLTVLNTCALPLLLIRMNTQLRPQTQPQQTNRITSLNRYLHRFPLKVLTSGPPAVSVLANVRTFQPRWFWRLQHYDVTLEMIVMTLQHPSTRCVSV